MVRHSSRLHMTTEVWFRNPHAYVRELAEVGGPFRIAWDRGMLVKKRIDPLMHAKVYFGAEADFRLLVVGPQGTAELDKNHTMNNPAGVYPTWEYGENFKILEEMVSSPIGEDIDACSDPDIAKDERPIIGQEHRVVIINPPNANLAANRPFYRHLKELQEEYPECIMHLHGSYSYRVMFGMGLRAADVEPRTAAANGKVNLPNGKELAYARTVGQLQWVNLLGVSVTDLKVPRERCIFNIKSALWAGEHFNENINFKSQGSVEVDPDSPITTAPTTARRQTFKIAPVEGDKIQCDSCSLSETCKYYRDGAVCSLPESESNALAKAFQSRDSSVIIDGLGAVLAAQTRRLERGMDSEEEFGELDPEVTKIMNQVFGNGVTLAKLIDPTLTKPMVQINNGAAHAVGSSNPKQMMAAIVSQLESKGHRREDITQEMVEKELRKMAGIPEREAIEGRVIG